MPRRDAKHPGKLEVESVGEDDDGRWADLVITADVVDKQGERLDPNGFTLKEYRDILLAPIHDTHSNIPVGRFEPPSLRYEVVEDEDGHEVLAIKGRARFHRASDYGPDYEQYPIWDQVWQHVVDHHRRQKPSGVSIGGDPDPDVGKRVVCERGDCHIFVPKVYWHETSIVRDERGGANPLAQVSNINTMAKGFASTAASILKFGVDLAKYHGMSNGMPATPKQNVRSTDLHVTGDTPSFGEVAKLAVESGPVQDAAKRPTEWTTGGALETAGKETREPGQVWKADDLHDPTPLDLQHHVHLERNGHERPRLRKVLIVKRATDPSRPLHERASVAYEQAYRHGAAPAPAAHRATMRQARQRTPPEDAPDVLEGLQKQGFPDLPKPRLRRQAVAVRRPDVEPATTPGPSPPQRPTTPGAPAPTLPAPLSTARDRWMEARGTPTETEARRAYQQAWRQEGAPRAKTPRVSRSEVAQAATQLMQLEKNLQAVLPQLDPEVQEEQLRKLAEAQQRFRQLQESYRRQYEEAGRSVVPVRQLTGTRFETKGPVRFVKAYAWIQKDTQADQFGGVADAGPATDPTGSDEWLLSHPSQKHPKLRPLERAVNVAGQDSGGERLDKSQVLRLLASLTKVRRPVRDIPPARPRQPETGPPRPTAIPPPRPVDRPTPTGERATERARIETVRGDVEAQRQRRKEEQTRALLRLAQDPRAQRELERGRRPAYLQEALRPLPEVPKAPEEPTPPGPPPVAEPEAIERTRRIGPSLGRVVSRAGAEERAYLEEARRLTAQRLPGEVPEPRGRIPQEFEPAPEAPPSTTARARAPPSREPSFIERTISTPTTRIREPPATGPPVTVPARLREPGREALREAVERPRPEPPAPLSLREPGVAYPEQLPPGRKKPLRLRVNPQTGRAYVETERNLEPVTGLPAGTPPPDPLSQRYRQRAEEAGIWEQAQDVLAARAADIRQAADILHDHASAPDALDEATAILAGVRQEVQRVFDESTPLPGGRRRRVVTALTDQAMREAGADVPDKASPAAFSRKEDELLRGPVIAPGPTAPERPIVLGRVQPGFEATYDVRPVDDATLAPFAQMLPPLEETVGDERRDMTQPEAEQLARFAEAIGDWPIAIQNLHTMAAHYMDRDPALSDRAAKAAAFLTEARRRGDEPAFSQVLGRLEAARAARFEREPAQAAKVPTGRYDPNHPDQVRPLDPLDRLLATLGGTRFLTSHNVDRNEPTLPSLTDFANDPDKTYAWLDSNALGTQRSLREADAEHVIATLQHLMRRGLEEAGNDAGLRHQLQQWIRAALDAALEVRMLDETVREQMPFGRIAQYAAARRAEAREARRAGDTARAERIERETRRLEAHPRARPTLERAREKQRQFAQAWQRLGLPGTSPEQRERWLESAPPDVLYLKVTAARMATFGGDALAKVLLDDLEDLLWQRFPDAMDRLPKELAQQAEQAPAVEASIPEPAPMELDPTMWEEAALRAARGERVPEMPHEPSEPERAARMRAELLGHKRVAPLQKGVILVHAR